MTIVYGLLSIVRSSHVEPEMDHVAIVHHVLFAFQPDVSLGACAGHPTRGHQDSLRHNLSPDEATLDVGVDATRPRTPSAPRAGSMHASPCRR